MYHRFHAPHDCRVEQVTYISGDTWNVNPIALKRIEKLFCKNERAVIRTRLSATGHAVTLVPVAAILVASIRLHCLERVQEVGTGFRPDARQTMLCCAIWRIGDPTSLPATRATERAQEMGWFEHGSTIILCPRRVPAMRKCPGGRADPHGSATDAAAVTSEAAALQPFPVAIPAFQPI